MNASDRDFWVGHFNGCHDAAGKETLRLVKRLHEALGRIYQHFETELAGLMARGLKPEDFVIEQHEGNPYRLVLRFRSGGIISEGSLRILQTDEGATPPPSPDRGEGE